MSLVWGGDHVWDTHPWAALAPAAVTPSPRLPNPQGGGCRDCPWAGGTTRGRSTTSRGSGSPGATRRPPAAPRTPTSPLSPALRSRWVLGAAAPIAAFSCLPRRCLLLCSLLPVHLFGQHSLLPVPPPAHNPSCLCILLPAFPPAPASSCRCILLPTIPPACIPSCPCILLPTFPPACTPSCTCTLLPTPSPTCAPPPPVPPAHVPPPPPMPPLPTPLPCPAGLPGAGDEGKILLDRTGSHRPRGLLALGGWGSLFPGPEVSLGAWGGGGRPAAPAPPPSADLTLPRQFLGTGAAGQHRLWALGRGELCPDPPRGQWPLERP